MVSLTWERDQSTLIKVKNGLFIISGEFTDKVETENIVKVRFAQYGTFNVLG